MYIHDQVNDCLSAKFNTSEGILKKFVAFFFGTLAKIIKYMNSQHNTINKQKLLKCLRCDDKDCNYSISKTSKAISLRKKTCYEHK